MNYMWDEYEITLSDAESMKDEEMNDLPAMKKEITALKDAIRKLGDVNVNAIEDYRNLIITINCVFFVSLCRYLANLPTLLSSSAASISQRIFQHRR